MKKRIWAVLCGMVRQEFELYNILFLLCEWRSKGIIEGVVISTWIGEPDVLPGLRQKCKCLGIHIIESPPLDNTDEKYSHLNYCRQATQVNAALSTLPADVWVLKCRTDFSMDAVYKLQEAFEADLSVKNIGVFAPVLRYKIAVFEFSTSYPFVLGDLAFFAHRSDMMRMIVFEDHYRLVKNGLDPDLLFFLNPFLHVYPFLIDYLRMVDYWTVGILLRKNLHKNLHSFGDNGLYLPSLLNKFYALYFMILEANFFLCSSEKFDKEIDFKFEDLFISNRQSGVLMGWGINIINQKLVPALIKGDLLPSKGWDLLSSEIHRLILDEQYAYKLEATLQDYQGMANWGEKYLGLKGRGWINWFKLGPERKNIISGQEADEILFSDYCARCEEKRTISDIWNSKQKNDVDYYAKIIKALPMLKNNRPLYEIAVAAGARKGDSAVLRLIAEDLASGNVSKTNEKTLSMVIERMRRSGHIFDRVGADDFIMFFFYGKYKALKGDDFLGDVIDRICRKWNLSLEQATGSQEENYLNVLRVLHDSVDDKNINIKNNIKMALQYMEG